MTTTVSVLGFLLFAILGARMSDGVRDSSIFEDLVGHEKHLDAATDLFTASTGNAEAANYGQCTIANRLEPGFGRKGEAFRETTTPDATYCANFCADAVKGCVAINYRASDKTCFLLADPGYIYLSAEYTTALVNPSPNVICNSANMILGHDRAAGDISGNPRFVSSATECCSICNSTNGCTAYTYYSGRKRCYLKSGTRAIRECPHCLTGLVCLAADA